MSRFTTRIHPWFGVQIVDHRPNFRHSATVDNVDVSLNTARRAIAEITRKWPEQTTYCLGDVTEAAEQRARDAKRKRAPRLRAREQRRRDDERDYWFEFYEYQQLTEGGQI
jgi:hypothetical protein